MQLWTCLFLITLSSVGSVGWASDDSIKIDFEANARAVPRRVLEAGYHQFGDVNLSTLLGELGQVNLRVVARVAHRQDLGPFVAERNSAEWHRGRSGDIALSGPRWQRTPNAAKAMLALHESLGALKYSDENYGCSGSLWILSDVSVRALLRPEELRHFETYADRACRFAGASGGSTGVTGGGDDFGVQVRVRILQSGLRKMRRAEGAAARVAALDEIEGSFYQGYEVNRHARMFDARTYFNSVKLQRIPVVESIRVFYNGVEIHRDSRNGWTYDPATNKVVLHGLAIPPRPHGAMSVGPSVLCRWAD